MPRPSRRGVFVSRSAQCFLYDLSGVLLSTVETNRILGMSFWKNPEDAERYRREQYPKVEELLRPVLETTPKVQTYDVNHFITHKIAMGKAA